MSVPALLPFVTSPLGQLPAGGVNVLIWLTVGVIGTLIFAGAVARANRRFRATTTGALDPVLTNSPHAAQPVAASTAAADAQEERLLGAFAR